MPRVYTKELRREIVTDFASRHGGHYDPAAFVAEVKAKGKKHPAFGWFEWDKEKAIHEYHLWQARELASGILVRFEVQELHRGRVQVHEREMPFVLSPMESRGDGGGYFITDPHDASHMLELCRQAGSALETWLRRYSAAISHVGGSVSIIERQLRLLQASDEQEMAEAAE